jgi:hypothetical protein
MTPTTLRFLLVGKYYKLLRMNYSDDFGLSLAQLREHQCKCTRPILPYNIMWGNVSHAFYGKTSKS